MSKGKTPKKETIAPSMTAKNAIPLIERQIQRCDEIIQLRHDASEIDAWESTTTNILNAVYGMPSGEMHPNTSKFVHGCRGPMWINMNEAALQKFHIDEQTKRKAVLSAFVEQLKDLVPEVSAPEEPDLQSDVVRLETLLRRFHIVVRQLRSRHASRNTLDVNDEYDVQDLLHALLRIDSDDVRKEEHAPSVAGKNTRLDFLLKGEQIVVEVKKTRSGLGEKELGGELIEDIARYQSHPDCKHLVGFIYDPDGRVGNPAGLKKDLEAMSSEKLKVSVVINP